MDPRRIVWIDYTNWRGERGWREILPGRIEFENSEYHPDTQHVLYATDVAKHDERTFAMKDVHEWRTSPPISLAEKK
jgi:hypothetical protein